MRQDPEAHVAFLRCSPAEPAIIPRRRSSWTLLQLPNVASWRYGATERTVLTSYTHPTAGADHRGGLMRIQGCAPVPGARSGPTAAQTGHADRLSASNRTECPRDLQVWKRPTGDHARGDVNPASQTSMADRHSVVRCAACKARVQQLGEGWGTSDTRGLCERCQPQPN